MSRTAECVVLTSTSLVQCLLNTNSEWRIDYRLSIGEGHTSMLTNSSSFLTYQNLQQSADLPTRCRENNLDCEPVDDLTEIVKVLEPL